MVSSRAKTPSGAAEAIPMPTEMDSRAVEIERRECGDGGQSSGGYREKGWGDGGQSCGDSEPSGEGQKKGSACKHCLSGWGKSTCP
ncbi:hypothetical protein [Prevotella sp. P4-51]|uniref:hypothetical protein n=1 Tax=Prevotella sp. P4-51 TaxID=2024228 RepID=UPI00117D7EA5|nr:hypothetical protein [Prevotella sp. P4-51]